MIERIRGKYPDNYFVSIASGFGDKTSCYEIIPLAKRLAYQTEVINGIFETLVDQTWGVSSVVERWIPDPTVGGSTPSLLMHTFMFSTRIDCYQVLLPYLGVHLPDFTVVLHQLDICLIVYHLFLTLICLILIQL